MEGPKFCSNCGEDLKNDAKFCQKCGTEVKIAAPAVPAAETAAADTEKKAESFTDTIAKNNPFPSLFKKTKEFLIKNKKPVIITAGVAAVLITGIVIFNAVWDFTKLEWDNETDIKLDLTSGTVLNVGVNAEDREKQPISEIEFTVSGGEVEVEGTKAIWTLPSKNGEYEISAKAPSGKTIKKTIKKVVTEEEDSSKLAGLFSSDDEGDENADTDNDGLTNGKEKELGTNPNRADSDLDGLMDKYEVEVSKTNPKKNDTDEDGLYDGDEISLGLDPNKADSKGDGVKDSERNLSYSFTENGVSVEINGKGNIASTSVDIINNASFKTIEGLSDTIYNFSTSGKLQNAKVTIKYDDHNLIANSIDEGQLTLYYLNDETKELEKVEGGIVNSAANTFTVELKHFSKYVFGNADVKKSALSANILFVIDNSVSMYTETQVRAAGYDEVNGADGNDKTFKRLSLTKDMIDKLTGSFKFGVAEFSGNYINLQKFTDNKDSAKSAVEKMRSKWNSNANGTNIAISMTHGIEEFTKNDNTVHYMVLLTDGKDTSETFKSKKDSIISDAKEREVKICTIGLGDKIDTEILNEISEATGCDYYSASDKTALDEIYDIIGSDINYGYTDTDDDNDTDGMIIADSGFIVSRDGFAFDNYGSVKSPLGHCFGIAAFAEARFVGNLPTSLDKRTLNYREKLKQKTATADGYDLSGTYFVGKGNLYDFRFTTPGLSNITFAPGKELPADYRDRIEDGVWMINKTYYDQLEKVGYNFLIKDANDYEKEVSGVSKIQSTRLDDNSSKLSSATDDEVALIHAIWRLFITQAADNKKFFFNSEPDKTWAELTNKLQSGDPVILGVELSFGGHAINAVKIVQDNNDANIFRLGVYDNNYPGELRYIEVTRKKLSKIALSYTNWTNDYSYAFDYYDEKDIKTTVEEPVLQ